jgi:hypothetical protein
VGLGALLNKGHFIDFANAKFHLQGPGDIPQPGRRSPAANSLPRRAGVPAPAFLPQMFNFSANHLFLISRTEHSSYAVLLMQACYTKRVYRLYDFSKAQLMWPNVAHCVAGKVNSADKLYLVIESVRPDTKSRAEERSVAGSQRDQQFCGLGIHRIIHAKSDFPEVSKFEQTRHRENALLDQSKKEALRVHRQPAQNGNPIL